MSSYGKPRDELECFLKAVVEVVTIGKNNALFSASFRMAGAKRYRFLVDTLVDLDYSLKNLDSRLLLFHGEPGDVY
ncbi:DNA photolyase [Artemisia annua]|uniref:DNA photolyase n=1 Tax=Artemisia annua TaxID=35608 RepID=A0A2U1NV40_ARTAN|nr:DNA photolyase [Artemisia annua]